MQLLVTLEKLYMNFFMRDLAYFFGGSFVIASFYIAKGKDLPFLSSKVSGGGLTSPTRHISLMRMIDGQKDSEATVLRIQRLIFLKHMMAAIATAFFVSSLIFLIQLMKGAANSGSLSLMFWVLLVLAILSFLDYSRLHYDEWRAKEEVAKDCGDISTGA